MNQDLQEESPEKVEQEEKKNEKLESGIKQNKQEKNDKKENDQEQNVNPEEKNLDDQEKQEQGEEGNENQEEQSQEQEEIQQTKEEDKRSIYVKNVDYMTSEQELIEFFQDCGKVNRVKIPLDKYTGQPKGYAYVEFAETEAVENAKALTDCLLRGRAITVASKRTNMPAFPNKSRGGRRPFFNQYRGYYSYRGPSMFNRFPGRRRYRPF